MACNKNAKQCKGNGSKGAQKLTGKSDGTVKALVNKKKGAMGQC